MGDVQRKFRSELQWQKKRSTKEENCSEELYRKNSRNEWWKFHNNNNNNNNNNNKFVERHSAVASEALALVWSVALYASETWTLSNDDVKRLEADEMWIWRKMENISWSEHITNEQVFTMVGEQRSLMDTIRQRQRNWIGHILRGN